jgi:hypothetical protein
VLWKLGARFVDGDAIPRDPNRLRPLVLENDVARGERIGFQVTDKWERLGIGLPQVVHALRAATELGPIHAIAAEGEAAYAQRIAEAAGIEVERYSSLGPWKDAIAAAAVLVAPDSGAVHVAGMVGTPTLAVYPPIRDFDLQLARWAPWAAPYRALRAERDWPGQVPTALHGLLDR